MAYHIITKLFHHPRLLSLSYVLPAFDVMTFRHFDIDDDIIREMISAWPLLQTTQNEQKPTDSISSYLVGSF